MYHISDLFVYIYDMVNVNWVEIPVVNIERARIFYEKAFSIEVDMGEIEGKRHAIMKMNGEVGGILHEVKEIQNGIAIYFHVDRMNEVLEKVEQQGGAITQPKSLIKAYNSSNRSVVSNTLFDGKIGYFAKIMDSEGNVLGLHSNS